MLRIRLLALEHMQRHSNWTLLVSFFPFEPSTELIYYMCSEISEHFCPCSHCSELWNFGLFDTACMKLNDRHSSCQSHVSTCLSSNWIVRVEDCVLVGTPVSVTFLILYWFRVKLCGLCNPMHPVKAGSRHHWNCHFSAQPAQTEKKLHFIAIRISTEAQWKLWIGQLL